MNQFRTILVHVDTNSSEHPGLDFAVALAKEHGSEIRVVDICPDFTWAARWLVSRHESMLREIETGKIHRLNSIIAPLQSEGITAEAKVLHGRTSIEMIREAVRSNAELVVKQSKGRHSRQGGFFGTTAQRLLRKCPCPVLIAAAGGVDVSSVAAAVEPSPVDDAHRELNLRLLKYADFLAGSSSSHILSAWEVYGENLLKEHMREEEFEELRNQTQQHAHENMQGLLQLAHRDGDDDLIHLLHGDPGDVIPKFVEKSNIGVLTMGTIGRSGVTGLMMGNTAERVFAHVECSVLAVKPAGFVSPVKLT